MFKKSLTLVFLFVSTLAFATDPLVEKLQNQELPRIKEPDIKIVSMSQGVRLYYLQNTELPIVQIKSYFEVGSLDDTYEDRGFLGLFVANWREGGSKKLAPDELDEKLEFLSASMLSQLGPELTSLSLTSLAKDFDELLPLYFDVMQNPRFDQKRFDVSLNKSLSSLSRRNENPYAIVSREFQQSLYGEKSPYAWNSNKDTLSKVTVQKFKDFHKSHIGPKRMRIAASSPLPLKEFIAKIEPYIIQWKVKNQVPPEPKPLKKEWEPSVELIDRELNQSAIILGHFGIKRTNPDKFALILANDILGGSTFGSRLGDRLRTDLGYTYGIRSGMGIGRDYGAFKIAIQTKTETTIPAIQEIKKILQAMIHEKPVTQAELDYAKERILNQLIFELDSPFQIVSRRLDYDYKGYPPKYLEIFQEKIEAVTLDQVNGVLQKYFFPDRLKIMIVGNKSEITDINKLGSVKMRPLDWE